MFNFFLKNKQDKIRHNSLDSTSTKPVDIINNFIKFAKSTTDKRAADFNSLMNFAVESNQWSNYELNLMDDDDENALTFNFSQEYLDRYMARLFPRNPHTGVSEVGVKVRESNADKVSKYEKEIIDIYYDYNLADILKEQGIDYLCGGAAILYYPIDPITKRAEIFSLNPTKCYLGWAGGKLVQFAFEEYIGDGKNIITYYDLANKIVLNEKTNDIKSEKNPYPFIPAYWIPNSPRPHCHEGISKIHLLSELDRLYNRTASNFDKRIEENTDPHLLIKSDEAEASKIERGRKKKTKLGKDDDMEYLELKEGDEIINWLAVIEKRITNKTGIVHSAGSLKTNTSGASLSFQFSDMMDLIGFMRLSWDKGFREMNNAILSYKFGVDKYNTDPVYQPFLIQDNKDRIDQYATMIEKNLISHRDAIGELRGVENAEEKLKEILEEKKLFTELEPKSEPNMKFNN